MVLTLMGSTSFARLKYCGEGEIEAKVQVVVSGSRHLSLRESVSNAFFKPVDLQSEKSQISTLVENLNKTVVVCAKENGIYLTVTNVYNGDEK